MGWRLVPRASGALPACLPRAGARWRAGLGGWRLADTWRGGARATADTAHPHGWGVGGWRRHAGINHHIAHMLHMAGMDTMNENIELCEM